MARKLKSDKLLFTATLVLVCASLVMVYSASAVIAMERFHKPTYFLFKQATFALSLPTICHEPSPSPGRAVSSSSRAGPTPRPWPPR